MLRTLFISVFLSLYIIVAGIPLLLYTVISKNPDTLYWAGVRGVIRGCAVTNGANSTTAGRTRDSIHAPEEW
jgi:hypothetical protein